MNDAAVAARAAEAWLADNRSNLTAHSITAIEHFIGLRRAAVHEMRAAPRSAN